MRKIALAMVVLGLFAVAADAYTLRLYFAPEGATELGNITGAPTHANPTLVGAGRLYLWAEIVEPTGAASEWNAIGMDVKTTGTATITGWKYYNYSNTYTSGGTYTHWQGVGQGSASGTQWVKDAAMVSVTTGSGVNNKGTEAKVYDTHSTYWLSQVKNVPGDTLLGYFDFAPGASTGSAFIYVNNTGILGPSNSLLDPIYMGFGDENAGLKGNSFNMTGATADANIIPEPASLLLLGLAGLALRRR